MQIPRQARSVCPVNGLNNGKPSKHKRKPCACIVLHLLKLYLQDWCFFWQYYPLTRSCIDPLKNHSDIQDSHLILSEDLGPYLHL